jgi:hypothetical protein
MLINFKKYLWCVTPNVDYVTGGTNGIPVSPAV